MKPTPFTRAGPLAQSSSRRLVLGSLPPSDPDTGRGRPCAQAQGLAPSAVRPGGLGEPMSGSEAASTAYGQRPGRGDGRGSGWAGPGRRQPLPGYRRTELLAGLSHPFAREERTPGPAPHPIPCTRPCPQRPCASDYSRGLRGAAGGASQVTGKVGVRLIRGCVALHSGP